MDASVFQNIDEPNLNPFDPKKESSSNSFLEFFKKNKNVLIISLSSLLFILAIIILLLSQMHGSNNPVIKMSLDQSTIQNTAPPANTNVSPELQEDFNKINAKLNIEENFLPPEIDPDFGSK